MHPIEAVPGLKQSIRLIKSESLPELPVPWPRQQDLSPTLYQEPSKDDLVLSVSHTWYFQAHPDPLGRKLQCLDQAIQQAKEKYEPSGRTLVFVDFLGCPQRPFAKGQMPRSREQEEDFAKALKLFPNLYLVSDATIHLEQDLSAENSSPRFMTVPASDLRTARLREVNHSVQLVHQSNGDAAAQPFCYIRRIGSKSITSLKDVEEAMTTVNQRGCWAPGCDALQDLSMTIEETPFGIRNQVPASEKGWVYLERFVSMVKIAMVPPDQASKMVFSNSERVLEQILQGGQKMRAAAAEGTETLLKALKAFEEELRQKQFAAISLDKAENTGGMGGMTTAQVSDAEVAQAIMHEMVEHLATHWQQETQAQLQRQLLLSVNRSDTDSVRVFLDARADPNVKDGLGMTSLHQAARCNSPDIVRMLLNARADLTVQDAKGNCAAHEVRLLSHSTTLELMEILAADEEVLFLNNNAGVSPVNRFRTWTVTELGGNKFPAAKQWASKVKEKYSMAVQKRGDLAAAEGKEVPCTTETYSGPHGPLEVKVWQCQADSVEIHILCVGLSFLSPPKMVEDAFNTVAMQVCEEQKAKLFLLGCEALQGRWATTTSFEDACKELSELIRAMPLNEKFVFVDSSLGETSSLVDTFRDRIQAALLVNVRGFHSEDFHQSSAYQKIQSRFQNLQQWFASRDLSKLETLLGDYAWAEDEASLEALCQNFAAALQSAPQSFFDHGAFHCRMIANNVMERTWLFQQWQDRPKFPRMMLLTGSFSPALWTHEAVSRVQAMLPSAAVSYLECCKSSWELEDEVQAARLGGILGDFMRKALVFEEAL